MSEFVEQFEARVQGLTKVLESLPRSWATESVRQAMTIEIEQNIKNIELLKSLAVLDQTTESPSE